MRTIDFYATAIPTSERVCGGNPAYTYRGAEKMLHAYKSFRTTQMSFLSDPLVCDYDRLVIHESGDVFTIENNHDGTWSCDRTDRQLRYGHNLFRLWQGGEFGSGDALSVDGHRGEGR